MGSNSRKHIPHKPSIIGKMLAKTTPPRWLFPLYNARQLSLCRHELFFDHLPLPFDGFTVAYASDIHYGALLDEKRLGNLAEHLNALHADVILLGGDYGEDGAHSLEALQKLPPLHAGLAVCAVLGNHDRAECNAQSFIRVLRARGTIPLVNSVYQIEKDGKRLALCATDDETQGEPDYQEMIKRLEKADFVLYAPHNPDALASAYAIKAPPFFDFAICGHTHGGQIAPCGIAPYTASHRGIRYGNHYRTGLIREKGCTVLISNGVGTTWMPVRVGAPAQYHLITLRKK